MAGKGIRWNFVLTQGYVSKKVVHPKLGFLCYIDLYWQKSIHNFLITYILCVLCVFTAWGFSTKRHLILLFSYFLILLKIKTRQTGKLYWSKTLLLFPFCIKYVTIKQFAKIFSLFSNVSYICVRNSLRCLRLN